MRDERRLRRVRALKDLRTLERVRTLTKRQAADVEPLSGGPGAKILELLEVYEPNPEEYQWLDESDRWAELVFCILNQFNNEESDTTREAVGVLQSLGLIDVGTLASTDPDAEQQTAFITHVLLRHGFGSEAAEAGVAQVRRTARFFTFERQTKLQQYMRRHAERIRDDLVTGISSDGSEERLRRAVVQWLQNGYNLPISLQSPLVDEYSKRSGFNMQQAIQAADDLDLNVVALDDVLEAEAVMTGGSNAQAVL